MKTRRTTIRRTAVAAIIVGTVSFTGAGAVSANHVHSKQVGNGGCVLLAQNSGEGEVDLPFATEAQVAANRAHPLHLLVHLGRPGGNFKIGVVDDESDPCKDSGDYLND